jgi:hypothetical protein
VMETRRVHWAGGEGTSHFHRRSCRRGLMRSMGATAAAGVLVGAGFRVAVVPGPNVSEIS